MIGTIFSAILMLIAGVIIFVVSALFGWICIFWAAFSSEVSIIISQSDSLSEQIALTGLFIYTALFVIYILVGFFYSSGRDLPPSLQVVAAFLRFPEVETAKAAQRGEPVNLSKMADQTRERFSRREYEPNWVKKARAKKVQKQAENLEIETELLKAESELHKASLRYNKAKAIAEAKRARK